MLKRILKACALFVAGSLLWIACGGPGATSSFVKGDFIGSLDKGDFLESSVDTAKGEASFTVKDGGYLSTNLETSNPKFTSSANATIGKSVLSLRSQGEDGTDGILLAKPHMILSSFFIPDGDQGENGAPQFTPSFYAAVPSESDVTLDEMKGTYNLLISNEGRGTDWYSFTITEGDDDMRIKIIENDDIEKEELNEAELLDFKLAKTEDEGMKHYEATSPSRGGGGRVLEARIFPRKEPNGDIFLLFHLTSDAIPLGVGLGVATKRKELKTSDLTFSKVQGFGSDGSLIEGTYANSKLSFTKGIRPKQTPEPMNFNWPIKMNEPFDGFLTVQPDPEDEENKVYGIITAHSEIFFVNGFNLFTIVAGK